MSDEAFAALVADIRENGLREAIVLYEGKVLDGRNRYRACVEVGIEPITKAWDQRGTALAYVISKNLHRRHLNESQRGMVADRVATLKLGANQHRNEGTQICIPSQNQAASMLNVSQRSIQKARVVRESGVPELRAAVDAGMVPLHSAVEIARQPQEEQRVIVSRGEKAITEAAKAIRAAAPEASST
jgi:ParB-like chromosome segregation protein Spo0J